MRNIKNTNWSKTLAVGVLVGIIVFTSFSIYVSALNGNSYSSSVTLGESVDNTQFNWTTGGNANWFGQTSTYYYDNDSAQSGAITHSQNTYIQTTVTGPGTLTFYWKVSSEAYNDYLRFYIDSTEQIKISGNVNWQQKNYSSIPPGTHTLKWKYTKDSSVSSSSDCGWLDKVEFVGSGGSSPTGTLKSLWTYQFGEICYRMFFGSSPAIADLGLDSTGNLQIVTGSEEYYPYTYGYNLSSYYYPSGLWRAFDSTGKILWMLDTKNDEARSSPVIADIDGNGDFEIAGGTTSGYQIQVFDHLGNFVWVYNTTGYTYVHSSPAIADVNPSYSGLEVIAGCYDKKVYCLSATGTLIWNYITGGAVVSSPAVADIDLDGNLEIVIGSTDKKVYCFNGATGTVKWAYTTGGAVYSSAALANLTGDGKLEVVVGSNDGKIYCLDGATGAVKWTYTTGNAVYSSPAIGDIDADGASEVVVGSTNGKVYALNNAGGVKWIYTTGGPVYSSPSLAYRGGSGLGVYIGSDDCQLYILNGYNGSLIDCYPVYGKICTSPSVADINGDGKLEILFTDQAADWNGSGDYFWCLQDNSSTCTPFALDWPMFRHDHYHTGLCNATQISTVDYIRITNTPGSTETLDQTVPVGFTITGNASSYNNTAGYIGTVSVTWSVTNAGGAGASASPLTGVSSTFNSGLIGGTAIWTANYTDKTDTVVFTITAPTVNNILIRTASGGGGSVVDNITYAKGATDTYWCAGYNYTTEYVGDYSAIWTSSDSSVGTVTSLGVSTTFTTIGEGMCTVAADYNGIIDITGIITVEVNHPPEIIAYSPETDPTIAEALSQTFAITAYDPDNDALTILWRLNGTLVETGNSYTFTSDYNSAGVYNITVTVSDGELTASHSWDLTVTNVNRPPAIDYYIPLTDQTINETDSITFNIIASDPDNDILTYCWYQNGGLLAGESNEGYTFISNFDSAGVYDITIIVSDGDLTASHSWVLTVINVNRAPVIDSYSPVNNPTIKEEESQMFSLIASDPDNDIITIDWYLDSTLVASGTSYTFTADFASTGSYEVTVVVSDGELSASHAWVLTVTNVNRAPVISSYYPAENPTIEEGDNQIFTITAYDLDNDALTYQWYLNGALIAGENNPDYTFVSDYNSAGVYNITVIVSDGELTASHSGDLTVTNVNRPPAIDYYNPLTDQTINEIDSITFNIIASDPDNDILTYCWYQNGGLLAGESNEGYTFISNFDSAGVYDITIIVSDGDLTASHSWVLTVMNVNRAPVIDSYSPENNPTIKEEESQMFSIIASDPDNDIITINWYLDGTLVASGASYIFTADFASTGSYEVKVVFSDGELSASHTWILTVTNVNRAPVISSYYPAEDPTIEEGDNQIFTITAYDLDNDALTYQWYLNGALIVGENNPAYTFVSDYNSAGVYNVTVIVSDGMLAITRSWSLTVININLLPIANFAYCQGIQVADGDYVNITLRVAGEKYRNVTLSVYEDGIYVCSVIVERTPGSPNDQSNTTSILIDSSKLYTILIEYTAEKKGGNPVWVTVEFKENSYTEHFVFNEDGEREELNLTEILDIMLRLTGFVKFDAGSSYDSDGEIVNYSWNFGDGSYGYGEIVYHNYQPGNYTVSLTVGDEYGALNTISKLINIVDVTGYCAAYKGDYYGVSLHCPADLTITDSLGGIIGYNATSGKFENWIPNAAMILGGFAPGDFEIYLIPKSPGDFEPGDFAYAYKIRGTDTGEYKFAVFDPSDFEPGDFNPGDFNPGDFKGRIYQVSSTTSGNSLDEVKITYDGRCIEITSNTEKEFSISFTNDTDIFNYCMKIVPNKTYKLKLSEFSLEEDFGKGTKSVEPSVSQTVDDETALKFLGSIVVVITILVAVRYKSWTRRKRELEGMKE